MANFLNPFRPGAGHTPPYLAGEARGTSGISEAARAILQSWKTWSSPDFEDWEKQFCSNP